jgi:uncharacterized protein (TIRG00374 family)
VARAEPDDLTQQKTAQATARARSESGRRHGRQLRNGIISLAILVALVVALVLAVPGLGGIERQLRHMDKDTIIGALALEFISCVGYVLTVQLVLSRAPRRFAARLAWSEMAFGAALGFGGAGSLAVGAWVLNARGVPARRIAERSATLFLLTSAVNVIVLIVSGTGLASGLFDGSSNPLLTVLPAVVGVLVLAFFLRLPAWSERLAAAHDAASSKRRRALFALLQGLGGSVRETRHLLVKRDWHVIGAWVYLMADISMLYICLDAFGHPLPFFAVVLAYQIGYLANVLPVPGGIGVLDSGLVGMLVLFGAKATPATAAVLVYHAIALWIPTIFGTIAFVLLRRSLSQPLVVRTE